MISTYLRSENMDSHKFSVTSGEATSAENE